MAVALHGLQLDSALTSLSLLICLRVRVLSTQGVPFFTDPPYLGQSYFVSNAHLHEADQLAANGPQSGMGAATTAGQLTELVGQSVSEYDASLPVT